MRSWSCPSCRSRRSSGPGRAAGTGRPRRPAPARSGRLPPGRRPARAGPREGAVRSSGSPGVIDGEVATRLGIRPGRRRVDLGPERERHRPAAEGRNGVGQLGRGPAVVDGHRARRHRPGSGPAPGRCGPGRGRSPGGPRSAPPRIASIVRRSRSIGAGHGHRRHRSRSSEARKSVTPSSAARIAMIQKRMVIFSSSQPPSSKW